MATIAYTVNKVRRLFPDQDEVYDFISGGTIIAGQTFYVGTADGKAYLANGGTAPTGQGRGVMVSKGTVYPGQAFAGLKRGYVGGYTLTNQAQGAQIFLGNGDGILADAAGTVSNPVARVAPVISSRSTEKALYFDFDWMTQHS